MSERFRVPEGPGNETIKIEPGMLIDGLLEEAREKNLEISTSKATTSEVTQKAHTLETLAESIADLRKKAEEGKLEAESLDMFIRFYLPTAVNNPSPEAKDFLKNLSDMLHAEFKVKLKDKSKGVGIKITGPELK